MAALACQKHLFSLEPGFHYINGAYMSPLLRSVEAAGVEGLRRKSQPYRISPADFFTDAERLRGLFTQLVNAESAEHVALVPSVSFGMAAVAKNLPARPGDELLVAEAQFPSNVYPWMSLAEDKGLKIKTVEMPIEAENRGRRWNERILEAINEHTALVTIGHAHWATGTRFDLEKIAEKVHRHGGLLVVDGTQSVGAMPLDVQKMGVDALVCAGYKWLLGPYSTGYAYFSKQFLDGKPVEENWINRKNSEDFTGLVNYQSEYQPGARRFDVGERSNFALVPAGIAALEQLLAWGIENIQNYCSELTREAIPRWQAQGFVVDDPAWRMSHLFGLQMPAHLDPQFLQKKLAERKIYVSVRGNFVRIAPNVYNDAADVEALSEAFSEVV